MPVMIVKATALTKRPAAARRLLGYRWSDACRKIAARAKAAVAVAMSCLLCRWAMFCLFPVSVLVGAG